jgi:hypothetical protein
MTLPTGMRRLLPFAEHTDLGSARLSQLSDR